MTLLKRIFTILILLLTESVIADANHHHADDLKQEKLGKVYFPVTCTSAAQAQFNQAVAMLHSFWYDEAEKAFRQVTVTDPDCVMGYWGIAMSLYQQLWATTPTTDELQRGRNAIKQAKSLTVKTAREKAYLDAAATLYPMVDDSNAYSTRKMAYQQAMEHVFTQYPDDLEAALFYALALISNASPKDKIFTKQKQALKILQQALNQKPEHPGIAHYIIHSSDYPELAELGLEAARAYTKIAPAVPHALHMPSHLFIRLGQWQDAVQSNLVAYQTSQDHAQQHNALNNTWDQRLHYMDYMLYAYLQLGETEKARGIVQQLKKINNAQPQNTPVAYAYAAIPARFAVERGDWHEAANLSIFPVDFPWQQFGWCEAIIHFARGIGAARTGNINAAKNSLRRLEILRDLDHSANKGYTADQIEIQRLAVDAWISAAENRIEDALQLMRASAALESSTEKDNVTPGAIIPARELLGEMLLILNQPVMALQELEASLQHTPNRRNTILLAAQAAKEANNQPKVNYLEQQYRHLLPTEQLHNLTYRK